MNTTPANWLIYCRPGFERDCAEETRAKPMEVNDGSGYLLLQGKPRLMRNTERQHFRLGLLRLRVGSRRTHAV